MTRPFLIDTDVGSDDAVALIMAFRASDVEVVGVTTVSGNVPVERATVNALIVADLCGADIPVYSGAGQPLVRPYADATFFHGQDGLGDQGYAIPNRQSETVHAVEAIIATVREHPGLVIVTLGPLTNLALALRQAPDIIPQIGRCVVMGGAACTYGNVTPAAEYNIWVDPDAARIVFLSGLPIEMVGWELSIGEYALSMDEIDQVRAIDTPAAHFTIDCNATAIKAFERQTGQVALALPDAVAMAVALDPTIATRTGQHYVDVETHSDLTRGMTVVDRLDVTEDARNRDLWAQVIDNQQRISVVWEVDARRWKNRLYDLLKA